MSDPGQGPGAVEEAAEKERERAVQSLVDEFSASLDEALVRAIILDYKDVVAGYEAIRGNLRPLAEAARVDETGDDPSGLMGVQEVQGAADLNCGGLRLGDDMDASSSEPASADPPTSVTSESGSSAEGVHSMNQEDGGHVSEEVKLGRLALIFPIFREHTLRFVLKQSRGDLERAFDELLNRQYLEENGVLPKGVDNMQAFDDDWGFFPRKRPKSEISEVRGRRARAVHVPYHVHLPSVNDADLEGEDESAPSSSTKAKTARGEAIMCRAWKALSTRTEYEPVPRKARLSVPSAPISLIPTSSGNRGQQRASEWQVVAGRKKTSPPNGPPTLVAQEASFSSAPMPAQQQAAALYRKGGANPSLYRQAASVYAAQARTEARQSSFRAAEELVAATARRDWIDLHGVSVVDGVRIAKTRVQRWWQEVCEQEERRDIGSGAGREGEGFTVVTGVGHHSRRMGHSRLRQAVGVSLKNDGWRVETLTGMFFVKGRIH